MHQRDDLFFLFFLSNGACFTWTKTGNVIPQSFMFTLLPVTNLHAQQNAFCSQLHLVKNKACEATFINMYIQSPKSRATLGGKISVTFNFKLSAGWVQTSTSQLSVYEEKILTSISTWVFIIRLQSQRESHSVFSFAFLKGCRVKIVLKNTWDH